MKSISSSIGTRFEFNVVHRGIGCADHDTIMPRNGKEHAAVRGLRNHDGAVAWQKRLRQHQMGALTGGNNGFGVRFIHLPDGIAENAGGVDDYLGSNRVLLPGL